MFLRAKLVSSTPFTETVTFHPRVAQGVVQSLVRVTTMEVTGNGKGNSANYAWLEREQEAPHLYNCKMMKASHVGKILLSRSLDIPILAVHVVRNPYDMIATNTLYRLSKIKATKASDLVHTKLRPGLRMLKEEMEKVFKQANSVEKVRKKVPIVEIHIEIFIKDPKSAV